MYEQSLEKLARLASEKSAMQRAQPLRYLVHCMLAGAYVGLGIVLIFRIGAPLLAAHSPVTSLVMGAFFGIALTLVVFAGAELFTGNNMYFTIGRLSGTVTGGDALRNGAFVFAGNLLGALALCGLVIGAGIFHGTQPDDLLFAIAAKKMHLSYAELFFRGILCNMLVCLALWSGARAKSETTKLILIWWMLLAFIASGYEHSVANMTLLSLSLLLPHPDTITFVGMLRNLVPVTLGNIVGGGLFIGAAYWSISPIRLGRDEAQSAAASSSAPAHQEFRR
ncbi:formate/nitrite transporter family protein [Paenibacillus albicereus]|uniref:Formate/nitrite transporter family protein n=1 Tax=Paenibacillus albicereus TaxID=2726185 RepID=A0A6H2GSN9_9BACL|nr:formate/nitrite transporter family protein [Paenibacillus albicereus]QJC50434.1 formate/nitrite transporter family protein [Paenibacillus albicereus]